MNRESVASARNGLSRAESYLGRKRSYLFPHTRRSLKDVSKDFVVTLAELAETVKLIESTIDEALAK